MNVIKERQEERLRKIIVMQKSIRKAKKPDLNKLIMVCCGEWGISKRTAEEYLKQALFNIENGK
jgi:hypothetical protein